MDITMSALQVLLLAIMFLAILVEVKTGGTGAGIIFGLVAAGVFWGSQYVKGAADLFQIGLFLGGILCIIVEMLLPTVGLLAGVGVAAGRAMRGSGRKVGISGFIRTVVSTRSACPAVSFP